ncbi:MAG: hypothetical protein HY614_02760, partial [Candidatus Rokubacteria bacterium]|nr:hypothetical protein [Candidatus Rokubacteria bacterium]
MRSPTLNDAPGTTRDLVELLAQEGLVDRAQLDRALVEQRRSNERIVSILLQRHLIGEAELVGFLSRRYRVPPVTLDGQTIGPDVLSLVPASVAWKYEVLPIERTAEMLTVAMADPTNVLALDDIAFMTGMELCPVVALRSEVQHEIRRHYGGQGGVPTLGHFSAARPALPSAIGGLASSMSDALSALTGDLPDVEVLEDEEAAAKVDVFELKE